ncbi:MAG: FAD-linked oxidase C-terminal domain-containing protein [Ilumatobacteraceae bacterium]
MDARCRASFETTRAALRAVPHARAASCHLSHSYPDGACLYFTFAATPPPEEVEATYVSLWDAGQRAVLAAGGNLSHHHGVGLNRARFMSEALGAELAVLQAVKDALDPHGILNPGKLGLRHAVRHRRLAGVIDWRAVRRRAARSHSSSPCRSRSPPAGSPTTAAASSAPIWLSLLALIGFFLGAGIAAWVQARDLPLVHGIVTAIVTYVVTQAVFVIIRLALGREVRWFALVLQPHRRRPRRPARRPRRRGDAPPRPLPEGR